MSALEALELPFDRTDEEPGRSQFHPTSVERATRGGSLIRRAVLLDQEDAYSAGEVGFLARALVQATLPHSDPKTNEFVRRDGYLTLSIMAPRNVGLPYGPTLASSSPPEH